MQWQFGFACTHCASTCGLLTGAKGIISISYYENNARCQWLITPTIAASSLVITFSYIETASQDYVTVYACSDLRCGNASLQRRMSGSYTSEVVTLYTRYALVEFTSDASVRDGGFNATWSIESNCKAGKYMVEEKGGKHLFPSYYQPQSTEYVCVC
jgi:hypothetical protein